jgi:hypothetical protein
MKAIGLSVLFVEDSMTLNIELPPEVESALRLQAAQNGQDMGAFVVQAVREKIGRAATFQAVCAPFAKAVQASGVTEEEFDRFFEESRNEVWRQKQDNAK